MDQTNIDVRTERKTASRRPLRNPIRCFDFGQLASNRDTLSGCRNADSQFFVFVNLVAHTPDRNSKNIGRPCATPTIADECMEDEFAFDLVDRVTDEMRND